VVRCFLREARNLSYYGDGLGTTIIAGPNRDIQ